MYAVFFEEDAFYLPEKDDALIQAIESELGESAKLQHPASNEEADAALYEGDETIINGTKTYRIYL